MRYSPITSRLVIAVVAVPLLLAGCGGAADAGSDATTGAAPQGVAFAAAPPSETATAAQVAAEKAAAAKKKKAAKKAGAARNAKAAKKAAAAKKAKAAKKVKAAGKAKAAAAARKAKAAAAAPACNPSYVGACVPNDGRDHDCPEIGAMVAVVGPDTDGLDRDNDGDGCESYG
jgi:hypothetical protein